MTDADKRDKKVRAIREDAAAVVVATFMTKLREIGIPALVVGIAMDEDPQGEGLANTYGNSTMILNLLCGLISRLIPEDFRRLQMAM